MRGLNETIMDTEPLLSLPMGPMRTLGDNRVGWIPNCEDAAPPRCAPLCKATCCAFCAFCAVRYSNSARASGGTCSACYAFCACYLVCTCCTRCARSTRFRNLTCNTVGHKSAPPARNVQMVAKGIFLCLPRAERNQRFLFVKNESMKFCCSRGFFERAGRRGSIRSFISTVLHVRSVSCRCLYLGFRAPCAARVTRVTCSKLSILGVPLETE